MSEIPLFMRAIDHATVEVSTQSPFVVLILGEIHEGDEGPVAREGFPIHWQNAKAIFMQAYLAACAIELQEKGKAHDHDPHDE